MKTLADLEAWFREAGRVLLGYSGGVDSAVLAVVGARVLGADFLAVTGRSASLSAVQAAQAREIAERHQVAVLEVDTDELADPGYRANAPDRCYFCKRELWSRLAGIAGERGFPVIVDGNNLDDLGEHRPGAAAGAERKVRSPYCELGWTKAMVRDAARGLGLSNWAAPAAPCLASRIRYGVEVSEERLGQVEAAEAFLRGLGVAGDLRVRHHGADASIEVDPRMADFVDARWPSVVEALAAIGFRDVRRDPRGYRRGSLLPHA